MSVFNRTQIAGECRGFTIDVGQISVEEWSPGAILAASALISPTVQNETGFLYVNSTEGQTGPLEPNWPTPAGAVVADGSLMWTAVVPPASGQDTISTVSCVQLNPPDGALGVSIQTSGSLTAEVVLSGGTTGKTYTTNAVITMLSGAIYIGQIILQVT